jgi:hypothetical protein
MHPDVSSRLYQLLTARLCAHAAFVELLDRLKMTKEQLLENKARVLSLFLSRILLFVRDAAEM